jgi:L-arabinose isomerase
MTAKPKVALLPLYLKLYDEVRPDMRKVLAPWLETVAERLGREGVDVFRCPICRVESEFSAAVRSAEQAGAEAILTLHLAYSPSLESADVLAKTRLPVVMVDTTMDYDFGRDADPIRLLYNHGVHGVQDLAGMLRRRGKHFEIVAGHFEKSAVLSRAADMAHAAASARRLKSTRALRVGREFAGMGDFSVSPDVLSGRLGIHAAQIALADVAAFGDRVTPDLIETEMALDRQRFDVQAAPEVHRRSVRAGLMLRQCLEDRGAGAFSVNFQAFDSLSAPVDTMPFLEISKAMERGIGYAGEGDVLTAGLVGALLAGWPRTTFTEIFCPDWKGRSLFLSHMGEVNPAVAATGTRPRICEKDFPWGKAKNPAVLTCALEPGPAVLVNLAPGPDDSFRLLVAPVEVLEDGSHPAMKETVRGWIRPSIGVETFLEEYSRRGGTHHSALVLGEHAEALTALAGYAGLDCCVIR